MTNAHSTPSAWDHFFKYALTAIILATIAWIFGRHAPYWIAKTIVLHTSAAPQHEIAKHPEVEARWVRFEVRTAFAAAALAVAGVFFFHPKNRFAPSILRRLYTATNDARYNAGFLIISGASIWFILR